MHSDIPYQILQVFKSRFHSFKPIIIASPGRINILGEHTDYNDGLVLPAAIDKKTYLAISKSDSEICNVKAYNLDEELIFNINDEFSPQEGHWSNYILGIIVELKKIGKVPEGFNCVFGGDIPLGAGLSSSAAIECGFIYALDQLFNFGLDKMCIAKLGQAAEHNFVGVKCGIMDQFANMHGQSNSAIALNCKTMEFEYHHSKFDEVGLWLFDTCVSHALGDSEYNTRRLNCEKGVHEMQIQNPQIESLSDATLHDLEQIKNQISPEVYRQCHYVIKENKRVIEATDAMEASDFTMLGEIMYATHKGLSEDYKVSCDELDFLVEQTKNYPQILGARMMGGGFGGCTLNLVSNDFPETLINEISKAFKQKFNHPMKVYKVNIDDGTKVIDLTD